MKNIQILLGFWLLFLFPSCDKTRSHHSQNFETWYYQNQSDFITRRRENGEWIAVSRFPITSWDGDKFTINKNSALPPDAVLVGAPGNLKFESLEAAKKFYYSKENK